MDYNALEQARLALKEKKDKYKKVFLSIYLFIIGFILLITLIKSSAYHGHFSFLAFSSIFMFIHPAIFVLVIYIFFTTVATRKEATDYRNAYKAYFVSGTMNKVFTDLKYSHEWGMPREVLANTGMINMGDRYSSNDYCIAKYKDFPFMQADVHIQEEHEDSDGDRTYVTIFRGRWVTFDIKKKFEKKLLVTGKSFYCERYDKTFRKTELESNEFNRMFDVYAQDGFEAFYLLDPAVMERIMKLSELHDGRIMICFMNGKMHIAINNNVDSFEPPVYTKPINEKAEFDKVMNDIKVITNIVDEVKLVK